MPKININIDGKQLQGEPGQTILEVAKANQIHIPTLCWMKNLSPVGACRMCLVDVEGMRKAITACTTPIAEGMKVTTSTEQLEKMRRMTLELLFSERNHFCPFCEVSGGDCELQQLGYAQKMDHIRFPYLFPNMPVDSSHPYIMLDHNRCILCTRCIRYCDEIEGVHTLDLSMRGNKAMITVDLHSTFENSSCTSCGGCVQICPTGALFNKFSAYLGKTKDCRKTQTICQQCSLGCGVEIYSKANHIVAINGDASSAVNEGHLCIKGRYEPLVNHKERIYHPSVLQKGTSIEFSWQKALDHIASRIKRLKAQTPDSIQAYISPQATNESVFQFLKFFREDIGTSHAYVFNKYEYEVFSKCIPSEKPDYSILDYETDVSRIDHSDCIIVLGADPGRTHKVLASRIRSRVRQQKAQLITINLRKADLDDMSRVAVRIKPKTDGVLLNTLINLVLDSSRSKQSTELPYHLKAEFAQYTPEVAETRTGITWDKIVQISKLISRAENPLFIFGRGLTNQNKPEIFQALLSLVRLVGKIENGKLPLLGLRHGANARGAFEMDTMLQKEKSTEAVSVNLFEKVDLASTKFLYLALGDDEIQWKETDLEKLSKVEFLVVQASYPSEILKYAHVVLPTTTWYEKSGTMNNVQGQFQSLHPVFSPIETVKDDWQIFAELEKRFQPNAETDLMKIQQEIKDRSVVYKADRLTTPLEQIPLRCISFLEEGK